VRGVPAVVAELGRLVGPQHVLTDDDQRAPYERDWTGYYRGRALAVVRPGTTAEVAAVLGACQVAGLPVVPQGGNTGLVGGSVPTGAAAGAVVLATTRLRALGEVDRQSGQVTAGAGVTLGELQRHLRGTGLDVGVDLAARDSATLGGMAATNAGGTRALREGTMRARVSGLEAVLASGDVLPLGRGLPKETSGYDLAGLLVGSEGTLAVVTAVQLRLVPADTWRAAALVGLRSLDAALDLAVALRDELGSLRAAEILDGATAELVQAERHVPLPVGRRSPWYLLVDCGGAEDPLPALVQALERRAPAAGAGAQDSAIATGRDVARLWRHRELASEALAPHHPHKLDVSLPLAAVPPFVRSAAHVLATRAPRGRLHLFGHLLDGNLHCNMVGIPADAVDEVDDELLHLAAETGGSIGAEHGIGRAKTRWLPLVRSPAELATFRALKAALDPSGILNPGVLVEPGPGLAGPVSSPPRRPAGRP